MVWHSALFLLGFGSAFSIGVTNNGCFLFWNSFWIMISLGKAVCRKNFGRIFFKSFLDLLKSFPVGSKSLFCFFCFLFVTKILQCAQYCVRQALALREAGDCRGVRAASLCGDCAACTCTLGSLHVLCAVCRQTGQHTERMAERARSVPRARLVQCRICVVQARGGRGAAEHAG